MDLLHKILIADYEHSRLEVAVVSAAALIENEVSG